MTDYRIILSHNGRVILLEDEDEPNGLRDIEVALSRHRTYHGIMPELSTSLEFHSRGYDFIRSAYNEFGINAFISCVIEFKDYVWETFFDGVIDLSDAKFTKRYVSVEIKANPCLDLFLNRLDRSVNLYDEPCFNELTADLEAYRTRYRFAPYSLELPEVELKFISEWKTPTTQLGPFVRRFAFDGGLGCTLFLCDGGAVPCGYSTTCDNLIGGTLETIGIIQLLPIEIVTDDLEMLTAVIIEPDQTKDIRDCGFGIIDNSPWIPTSPDRIPFDINIENIGTAVQCRCQNYLVELDYEVYYEVTLNFPTITSGRVEFVRVEPRFVFRWGNMNNDVFVGYERVITIAPTILGTGSGPCTGYIGLGSPHTIGSDTMVSSDTFFIDSCTEPFPLGRVAQGDYLSVHVEYVVGGIFEGSLLATGQSSVDIATTVVRANGKITSVTCGPNPPIGNSTTNAYFLHEAFSRLVEHNTNNCMRVKSEFFGRPNSLEWGDDASAQCPTECGGYPFYPAGNPCSTFDLTEYQTSQVGCGGHTVITNGTSLRRFGTSMFVSFSELYNATNAVFAIGMGWSADDPNNIRIENWEYFYQNNIVLDLGEVDEKNAEVEMMPSDHYINRFACGYNEWLTDLANTVDIIHSSREYNIQVKNSKEALERKSDFVGDAYAIEWQRRQALISSTGSYDDKKFFICVGRGDDTNNTVTISTPDGPVTYPNHIFIAEQGVDNPTDVPYDIINYRIAPSNIYDRWNEWLSLGLWTETGVISFAKGEANFTAGGNNIYTDCEIDKVYYENDSLPIKCCRIFPEYVTISYPLTPYQYRVLRNNPYGLIIVNREPYYLVSVSFKPNSNSKIKLLRAKLCD